VETLVFLVTMDDPSKNDEFSLSRFRLMLIYKMVIAVVHICREVKALVNAKVNASPSVNLVSPISSLVERARSAIVLKILAPAVFQLVVGW
jgi:hypothetical protein